jgi:hypothetical protein
MTFVKGQSGNPKGCPPASNDIQVLKALSRAFVETKIAAAMQRTVLELEEVWKDPKSQAIDVAMSAIMIKSSRGDYKAFNFLLDRVIGRVVEKIDMKVPTPFMIRSFDGKEEIKLGMKQEEED